MKMKNIKHLLTLIAAAALSVSAWAQSADADSKSINAQLNDKNAKPSDAMFQQLSKAIVDFMVAYPGDKNAPAIVNSTLAYGAKLQANKMPALAQAWYSHVQNGVLDKQIEPSVTPAAKDALTALMAAMAEGEAKISSTADNLTAWRDKLDKLLNAPAGTPFVLDREKSYYTVFSSQANPAFKKLASDRLAQLAQHKDKNISGWAKQEMKYNEMKKAPFTLSVTTLDGKKFDTAALKSPLYLYFWSIGDRKAEDDLKKLAALFASTSRKQLGILVVCCDDEAKRDDVNALIKKNKLTLPVYFDGKGKKGDLCEKFGLSRTPIGFLFDGKGNMLAAGYNYADIGKKK